MMPATRLADEVVEVMAVHYLKVSVICLLASVEHMSGGSVDVAL